MVKIVCVQQPDTSKCSLKPLSSLTIWIFCVNQLFINFGIPSHHASFLLKQCNKFDASSDVNYSWHHHALSNKKQNKKTSLLSAIYCTHFLICVPSSFVGKIYTHQRSGHTPGVRFCKYLLVNLFTAGMSVSAISPLFSLLCQFP